MGYLVCSKDLLRHFVNLKQAADIHSNRLSQWIVLHTLTDPERPAHLESMQERYRASCDAFELSLRQSYGAVANWEIPRGSLFFWLTLNQQFQIDSRDLLECAIERGVAFMPGEPFFATDGGQSVMIRLNFSHASEHAANRGLKKPGRSYLPPWSDAANPQTLTIRKFSGQKFVRLFLETDHSIVD